MPKTTSSTDGTLTHRCVDLALRGLIGVAKALPYKTRVQAFGALTAGTAMTLPRFAARMEDNLSYALPDLTPDARKSLARRAANNIGRLVIENYSGPELMARMSAVEPTGPGLAAISAAKESGQPVLFLTGHFGNYEAARACLIGRGYAIGGLYRPLANPYFNRHYVQTMETIGGPIFAQGREGTTGLMRHLKGGGMAMLLNDLYVGSGLELPFLDRPAMTATSAAEIALRLGALLVPVYGIRAADGLSFAIEIEAPIAVSDATTMTRAYNDSISARIRANPEQWFWVHRRWKRKWKGGAGADGADHPAVQPRKVRRL